MKNFSAVLESFTGVLITFCVAKGFLGTLKILMSDEGVCSKQENFWPGKKYFFSTEKLFSSDEGL